MIRLCQSVHIVWYTPPICLSVNGFRIIDCFSASWTVSNGIYELTRTCPNVIHLVVILWSTSYTSLWSFGLLTEEPRGLLMVSSQLPRRVYQNCGEKWKFNVALTVLSDFFVSVHIIFRLPIHIPAGFLKKLDDVQEQHCILRCRHKNNQLLIYLFGSDV